MLNAKQLRDALSNAQIEIWNRRNAEARERTIDQVSVVGWLEGMGRRVSSGYEVLSHVADQPEDEFSRGALPVINSSNLQADGDGWSG
jgi:hypothetical protein